jgi:hypothetical protein
MEIDILGIDFAKHVFQLHAPTAVDGLCIERRSRVARSWRPCAH